MHTCKHAGKVTVTWSPLASQQPGWSLALEWNSYKVHSYVLLWFLNAKRKKKKVCWQVTAKGVLTGAFLLAESTLGLFGKIQGESRKTLPPARWPGVAVGSTLMLRAVQALAVLASPGTWTVLAGSLCRWPGPGPHRCRWRTDHPKKEWLESHHPGTGFSWESLSNLSSKEFTHLSLIRDQ